MGLPKAGDERLTGLDVARNMKCRVFFQQTLDRHPHLVQVALGLRVDRRGIGRRRKRDTGKHEPVLLIAQGISGGGHLQLRDRSDIARRYLMGSDLLLTAHHVELADALILRSRRIEDVRIGRHRAGINPEKGELAHVGIGDRLEHQRGERTGRIRRQLDCFPRTVGRGHRTRGRERIDDRVEEQRHALDGRRRAREDRHGIATSDGLHQPMTQLIDPDLVLFQIPEHELFVVLADLFHELGAQYLSRVSQIRRHVRFGDDAILVAGEKKCFAA